MVIAVAGVEVVGGRSWSLMRGHVTAVFERMDCVFFQACVVGITFARVQVVAYSFCSVMQSAACRHGRNKLRCRTGGGTSASLQAIFIVNLGSMDEP